MKEKKQDSVVKIIMEGGLCKNLCPKRLDMLSIATELYTPGDPGLSRYAYLKGVKGKTEQRSDLKSRDYTCEIQK